MKVTKSLASGKGDLEQEILWHNVAPGSFIFRTIPKCPYMSTEIHSKFKKYQLVAEDLAERLSGRNVSLYGNSN